MKDTGAIDFVITWVDDRDPVWRAKREKYTGREMKEGNTEVRYRDWDTLKYWFRGVEKFAPWVRYVYFVTDDQKPEWLNLDHPKLQWVKHTDFIPAEYLPTFNSNVIDWNLYRIKGLSENFVFFNDDVFLIDQTVPEDFFVDGLPCELPHLGLVYPVDLFSNTIYNNTELLNRHFGLQRSIRRHWTKWIKGQSLDGLVKLVWYGRRDLIPGLVSGHIHAPFKKSTFEVLWEKEYACIHNTCLQKLRSRMDVTTYCVSNWQILTGNFFPRKPLGRAFATASMGRSNAAMNYLCRQKGKVICLNDGENETDFQKHKQMIVSAFDALLPDKSSFEL